MAEIYKNVDEKNSCIQEADFFSGKLRLISKEFFALQNEDVLVVPCHPDILSGGHVFNAVYDKLGHTLTTTLQPYMCLEAGSCKLMQSGDFNNYKKLAMCVLPELYEDEGLTRLDRVKVAMCIADALDLSAEASSENIVFTHWPIASVDQSAEILLLCLAHWIRYSVYFDRVKRITVALDSEDVFSIYYEVAKLIEDDPSLILDVLQERRPDEYGNDHTLDQELTESLPLDFSDSKVAVHAQLNTVRMVQDRRYNSRNGSTPFLFYSRNLSTSILSIEQNDGSIRQYRLSTTVSEKNTHYFRCSRCDYLSRSNEELGQFRPKITVRDGAIANTRFPEHHPMCRSTTKEKFVMQQLDRLWKAVAIYETDELRRCYLELRTIAQKEPDLLYLEMESSTGRFPEWEMMKQIAEKYHNQYSIRLIKCSVPTVSGVDIQQYSEIRRVEDEIDGVKDTAYAWITEGVELSQDEEEQEVMELDGPKSVMSLSETQEGMNDIVVESQPALTDYSISKNTKLQDPKQSRPQRIVRPTYKIRGSQGTSSSAASSMRFRIVRPQKSPIKRSHN